MEEVLVAMAQREYYVLTNTGRWHLAESAAAVWTSPQMCRRMCTCLCLLRFLLPPRRNSDSYFQTLLANSFTANKYTGMIWNTKTLMLRMLMQCSLQTSLLYKYARKLATGCCRFLLLCKHIHVKLIRDSKMLPLRYHFLYHHLLFVKADGFMGRSESAHLC